MDASQTFDVDNFDRHFIDVDRKERSQWLAVNEIQAFAQVTAKRRWVQSQHS